VAATRAKQLEMWTQLIVAFVQHTKRTSFNVSEAAALPPFANKSIDRRLPVAGVRIVLDALCDAGFALWTDGAAKNACCVTTKRFEEWATLLSQWASQHHKVGAICTVFELRAGDECHGQGLCITSSTFFLQLNLINLLIVSYSAFYGLDAAIMVRALQLLQKNGQVSLIPSEVLDEVGVKFLK
jgi:hypothetical protein